MCIFQTLKYIHPIWHVCIKASCSCTDRMTSWQISAVIKFILIKKTSSFCLHGDGACQLSLGTKGEQEAVEQLRTSNVVPTTAV